jgi:hypothetical protein
MTSDEEGAQWPVYGASSSKDPLAPLESESEHDVDDNALQKSVSEDDDDEEVTKKSRNCPRLRVEWTTVLTRKKGEAVTME